MLEKLDIAVINLDRRPDRMAYIYKHIPFLFRPMSFDISGFNMPGFPGCNGDGVAGGAGLAGGAGGDNRGYYRRFPAIDGLNLSQHYTEFPDLLNTIRNKPRVLGEVGCSLSHYSLWKSHAQRPKSDILLVFEDDVLFTEKSLERMKGVLAGLTASASASASSTTDSPSPPPPRWDIMYVGGQWTPDYDIDGTVSSYFPFQQPRKDSLERYFHTSNEYVAHNSNGIYKRRNLTPAVIHGNRNVWFTPLFRTAGAYLVSKRGAKRLLEAVELDTALFMKTPLDMWLLEMDFRGYIDAFDRFPHPFYQAGFEMVREPSHAQNDIHRTDFQTVKLPAVAVSRST
jgi:GR25 family glycosyltransferase involved in LPS biosynthesis